MKSLTDELPPLDEHAFGARVDPHRRELHVQDDRLPGSFAQAEDLVRYGVVTFGRAIFSHFDPPATLGATVGAR